MRKIKSEILKACGKLMNEMAWMPEEIEDDGLCEPILLDIKNAMTGVEIIKRKYGTADNKRKN